MWQHLSFIRHTSLLCKFFLVRKKVEELIEAAAWGDFAGFEIFTGFL